MKKERLMAATTIFLWATLPPMTKLLLADFPSMTLLYYSSIIASVALILFLLLTGRISKLKTYSLRDFIYLTGLGILGEFLYSALYYQGLTLISSTDACILNYLWPIAAVVFSCIFLKEKLTIGKSTAIMLSFFGVILVTSKGTGLSSFSESSITGCILCILAAFCYGLFNVLNKMFGKDQWINMTFYFVLTAFLAGISCHSAGQLVMPSSFQWLGIFWLGLFIDAIGIVIWAIALQNSEVSYLVNFAYATPVLAMILSTIFLKEKINLYSCVGLTLILCSFLLQNQEKNNLYAWSSSHRGY